MDTRVDFVKDKIGLDINKYNWELSNTNAIYTVSYIRQGYASLCMGALRLVGLRAVVLDFDAAYKILHFIMW